MAGGPPSCGWLIGAPVIGQFGTLSVSYWYCDRIHRAAIFGGVSFGLTPEGDRSQDTYLGASVDN